MKSRSQVLTHLRKQGERNVTRSQKTAIVSAESYLSENKIEEMLHELMALVILHRPKDVKIFLREQLELQIKIQGDNYYFQKQDFEAMFLNYDFLQESKVPFTMLLQALGLAGVEYTVEDFKKKYPAFQTQKYVLKEEFIFIMMDEYRERIKKYRSNGEEENQMMQAIASDSFLNDILIYCDLEEMQSESKEGYSCMKRILDYMLENTELILVEQFKKSIALDVTREQLALILNAIAVEMLERGYFKECEAFLKESQNERVIIYGSKSIEVAKTHNNLGLLRRQMEDYDSAIQEYNIGLSIYQTVYGKDHLACVHLLENMAVLLRSQGKYDEALKQYEAILRIKKAQFGQRHLETASTLENIAVVFIKQNKIDQALQYLNGVLEIKKHILGENTLTVAGTLHNISIALESKKQIKKALLISKNALKISKNESVSNSFVRTVERQVKHLEENINLALDISFEM